MILRLLLLFIITTSAFGAENIPWHGCTEPVISMAPAGGEISILKRFEEDVRILPPVTLSSGELLVAERINYKDPRHYRAVTFLDASSLSDSTSFIKLSLSDFFPQCTERYGNCDEVMLHKLRKVSEQERFLPFQPYIVYLRTEVKEVPAGVFTLCRPMQIMGEKRLHTPLTIFLQKEYRGKGIARGMMSMVQSLTSRMLNRSVRMMDQKGELSWSDGLFSGWIAMVARTNYPSLGLFLGCDGAGLSISSDCHYAHIMWPASLEEQKTAHDLRAHIGRKK